MSICAYVRVIYTCLFMYLCVCVRVSVSVCCSCVRVLGSTSSMQASKRFFLWIYGKLSTRWINKCAFKCIDDISWEQTAARGLGCRGTQLLG